MVIEGKGIAERLYLIQDLLDYIDNQIKDNSYGEEIDEIFCMLLCTLDDNKSSLELDKKELSCNISLDHQMINTGISDKELIEVFVKEFFNVLSQLDDSDIEFASDRFKADFMSALSGFAAQQERE